MRFLRVAVVSACLLAAAAFAAGCGGEDDEAATASAGVDRPAPPRSDFPSAEGMTLAEVLNLADGPSPLVVSPAARAFFKGPNRYPFGVFERDRSPVNDAEVALYFAKVPPAQKRAERAARSGGAAGGGQGGAGKARARALDQPAIGPFPAEVKSLETKPAFRALTTAQDPDAANVVYVTEVDFPTNGEWRIAALLKEDGEMTATLLPSAVVGEFDKIPAIGEKAPRMHTPTAADFGGDREKVTTRVPPDTQNEVDYADVYGKKPIILLFATPQFCESRVCGPVVDIAEEVKQDYEDRAAFIHMEIYIDNDPGNFVRPQVRRFALPSEPWLFAIDRDGVVRHRIEGAFSDDELVEAVRSATR